MESELKSRAWLENSPVCTKIVDLDFNLQYMSSSGIMDLKIDDITEFYGKPYPLHFYPDSFKIPMTNNLRKVKKTGMTITQEAPIIDVDGKELWYHSTIIPVNDDKGKLDYIMVISMEITEHKQAETELRMERDKLTMISESMLDGVYIVNKNYDIQYVNKILIGDFGPPEGKKCYSYFHGGDEPCTFCKNEDVFAGKTVRWEWTSPNNGKTYDLIDSPMKNSDGSISKLEIFRDITDRKETEAELLKHHNHLEELVKERTSELEESLKNVERMNELFVNREFRIKELRDELKELKKKD